jgi:hypothetical protein
MWLQWDWGEGPRVRGRRTQLFAAWLAWSRFRVVIPVWDQQLGTLTWCIDQALRAVGGAPTYLLTDYVARNIIGLLCPAALCGWRRSSPCWPRHLRVMPPPGHITFRARRAS